MTKKDFCHRNADYNEAIYDLNKENAEIESRLRWDDGSRREWYLERLAPKKEELERLKREQIDFCRENEEVFREQTVASGDYTEDLAPCLDEGEERVLLDEVTETAGTLVAIGIGAAIGWAISKLIPPVVDFTKSKVIPPIEKKLSNMRGRKGTAQRNNE